MGNWSERKDGWCRRNVGIFRLAVCEGMMNQPEPERSGLYAVWVSVGCGGTMSHKALFPSLDAAKRWAETELRRLCDEALASFSADDCPWCGAKIPEIWDKRLPDSCSSCGEPQTESCPACDKFVVLNRKFDDRLLRGEQKENSDEPNRRT